MLRAEAETEKSAQLALLDVGFAQKISAARQQLKGDALSAALAVLKQEHAAARRVLIAELAARARMRRRMVLTELRAIHKLNATVASNSESAPTRRQSLRTRARRRYRLRRKPSRNTPPKPRQ